MTLIHEMIPRIEAPAGLVLALTLAASVGCGAPSGSLPALPEIPPRAETRADRPTVVIIGIDGGEWSVIRSLQARGKLPNLSRLESEGISASLGTAYGASPVIWTTIATGRGPADHGITDFVVATEEGTVPVSSSLRRVPALWNMATRAGLVTAVVGWWVSWPAEEIRGVVITDHAHLGEERVVHPPGYAGAFMRERELAREELPGLGGRLLSPDPWMEDGALRDRITAHEAVRLAGMPFDLILVYFREVDIASHRYWKYHEPGSYPGFVPDEGDRRSGIIPTVYEATDRAIGGILDALPGPANVFVVSDHGFLAGPEQHFVNLDMDALLERLGFLVRTGEAVEFGRSVAYTFGSPNHAREKLLRLSLEGREPGGSVTAERRRSELERLARSLERLTYGNGTPLFTLRREGLPPGADLAADVNLDDPTMEIRDDDETIDGVIQYINRISGTHNESTAGIFIARGPDLDPSASAQGLTVDDIAPTILYALGLPVGEDFAGRAREELFTEGFRTGHPLRSVPSWGTKESWRIERSPEDSRLLEELRSLGYL